MSRASVRDLLADKQVLSASALISIGLIATLAQAGAWRLVHLDAPLLEGLAIAAAFWFSAIIVIYLIGRSLKGRTISAGGVLVIVSAGMLIGATSAAILGWIFGNAISGVVWAVLVAIESLIITVGGLVAIQQRRANQSSLASKRLAISVLEHELAAIDLALITLRDAETDAIRDAKTSAQRASRMLDDQAPREDILELLEQERMRARSASHEIASMAPPRHEEVRSERMWLATLGSHANFTASFLLVAVLGLPIAAIGAGWRGVLMQGVGGLAGWIIAHGVMRLTRERFASSASLIALGAGCLTGASIVTITWVGFSWLGVIAAIAITPLCASIALIPNIWLTTLERDERQMIALESRVEFLELRIAESRADLERARSEFVSTLHTTVQGRATAAIVALGLGVGRAEIDAILSSLGTPDTIESCDPLDSVLNEWGSVLTITHDIDPAVPSDDRARLARHVGESLLNATRHGQARAVHVRISRCDDHLLLTVTDDGRGPAEALVPGLGSSLAQREGGTWSIAHAPAGGARLEVRLPRQGTTGP